MFANQICEEKCNVEECLFDGWDCIEKVAKQNDTCAHQECDDNYDNQHCDVMCNTPLCHYDGGDCGRPASAQEEGGNDDDDNDGSASAGAANPEAPNTLGNGRMVLTLGAQPTLLMEQHYLPKLLLGLSKLLHCVVRAERDREGRPIIQEVVFSGDGGGGSAAQEEAAESPAKRPSNRRRRSVTSLSDGETVQKGSRVNLVLDNSVCHSQKDCFTDGSMAAQFVVASMRNFEYKPPVPIFSIGFQKRSPPGGVKSAETSHILVILVTVLLLLLLLLCVGVGVLAVVTFRPQAKERSSSHHHHTGGGGGGKSRGIFKRKAKSKGTFFPGLQPADAKPTSRQKKAANKSQPPGSHTHSMVLHDQNHGSASSTENNLLLGKSTAAYNPLNHHMCHCDSQVLMDCRHHNFVIDSHHHEHLPMLSRGGGGGANDAITHDALCLLDVSCDSRLHNNMTQQSTRETSLHEESPGNESGYSQQSSEMKVFHQMKLLLWDASQHASAATVAESVIAQQLTCCLFSLDRYWNDLQMSQGSYDIVARDAAVHWKEKFWKIKEPNCGETLLHLAARFNNVSAVRLFLDHGGSMEEEDYLGHTPLLSAANAGALECYKLLYTELIYNSHAAAAASSSLSSDHTGVGGGGGGSNSMSDLAGKQQGSNANAGGTVVPRTHRNVDGSTALMLAIKSCHNDLVDFILAQLHNGGVFHMNNKSISVSPVAELNAVDKDGRTVLHWASITGQTGLVQRLLAHYAGQITVDAQTHQEETPLFLAAKEGHLETCQVLLELGGANADLSDHIGRTCRSVAHEAGFGDIVHLLDHYVPVQNGTGNGGGAGGTLVEVMGGSARNNTHKSNAAAKHRAKENGGGGHLEFSYLSSTLYSRDGQGLNNLIIPPASKASPLLYGLPATSSANRPPDNVNVSKFHRMPPNGGAAPHHYAPPPSLSQAPHHPALSQHHYLQHSSTFLPQQQQQQAAAAAAAAVSYLMNPTAASLGLTPSPDTDSPCQLSLSPASPYRTRPNGGMMSYTNGGLYHPLGSTQLQQQQMPLSGMSNSITPTQGRIRQNSVNDLHQQFMTTSSFNPAFATHRFMP